jgi:ArsR family transcriptional regulator, arsenate/arsenite/antimonite-responsive transcriptional repressor
MQDLLIYFRALGDRRRLAIIQFLSQHDEITVTQLGKEMRLSQPLISWHLRLLRRAGIVKTKRVGRQVHCSLNRRTMLRYQERVREAFGLDEASAPGDTQEAPSELEAAGPRT